MEPSNGNDEPAEAFADMSPPMNGNPQPQSNGRDVGEGTGRWLELSDSDEDASRQDPPAQVTDTEQQTNGWHDGEGWGRWGDEGWGRRGDWDADANTGWANLGWSEETPMPTPPEAEALSIFHDNGLRPSIFIRDLRRSAGQPLGIGRTRWPNTFALSKYWCESYHTVAAGRTTWDDYVRNMHQQTNEPIPQSIPPYEADARVTLRWGRTPENSPWYSHAPFSVAYSVNSAGGLVTLAYVLAQLGWYFHHFVVDGVANNYLASECGYYLDMGTPGPSGTMGTIFCTEALGGVFARTLEYGEREENGCFRWRTHGWVDWSTWSVNHTSLRSHEEHLQRLTHTVVWDFDYGTWGSWGLQ
ncbi:hypothetical protein CONPUDRAFT_160582 [Coniophora puteana RWD-64-598 SS2]|uniref:Uncharacterized protein n=1 Tax=Coniophora puteana (strain RWD-64-598) TaxID=741705 RepID=R7SDF7_CONPW|nr:uncharacterized protein CONPUDRAFT_160582 [Coniophora puteana RWD-64-598 SS2]EIW73910.1 hypothetical protein CONPUDRAFT_160582 [Coniophora puteana RWD-64-598 SS2]